MRFDRLAFDSNAAIDLLRGDNIPPPLQRAGELYMPLFVLAELRLGVSRSSRRDDPEGLDGFARECTMLLPDLATIEHYVAIRHRLLRGRTLPTAPEKREGLNHDIWIAALCVQHALPLLTRDQDFDGIPDLEVIRW